MNQRSVAISAVAAIAATAATATTEAAATTTATTATWAIFAGLGFVDGQGAAFVLLAVEGGDCLLGLFIVGHFDEAEAFASAGVAVIDDLSAFDRAVRREQLFEDRAIDVIAQVPHI